MANIPASVSIKTRAGVPNAPFVQHHATLLILIGLRVPTFATLVGRIGLLGRSSVVRSSAVVSIHTHAQLPVAPGYSVASVRMGATVVAHAVVMRGATVGVRLVGYVSDTSRTQADARVGVALRSGVVAGGHRQILVHAGIGTAAGIAGHARALGSGVDVIRTAASVVARAFPHYAVHVAVAARASVVAVGSVPLGVRICSIGMGRTVSAKARVAAEAADAVRGSMKVTATPQVSRRTPVTIVTGLRGRLTARNLIGGHVGVATVGHVGPSEGRGVYGRAMVLGSARVNAYATTSKRAAVQVQTGVSVVAKDTKLANAKLTVKAAAIVVANMIRTAQGKVTVAARIQVTATGDRNSLGGIQSTVTPINPKGSVSQLGPTSTISVIP